MTLSAPSKKTPKLWRYEVDRVAFCLLCVAVSDTIRHEPCRGAALRCLLSVVMVCGVFVVAAAVVCPLPFCCLSAAVSVHDHDEYVHSFSNAVRAIPNSVTTVPTLWMFSFLYACRI